MLDSDEFRHYIRSDSNTRIRQSIRYPESHRILSDRRILPDSIGSGVGFIHLGSSSASSISTEFSYRTNYQAFKPDELDEYLEADLPSEIVNENPLQFWSSELASSKFPVLKSFARKLFSIPATSSGTERLFSYSGIILNNRRQRLSPDKVDNMLVIRSARQVLKNVKQTDSTSKLLFSFVEYFYW